MNCKSLRWLRAGIICLFGLFVLWSGFVGSPKLAYTQDNENGESALNVIPHGITPLSSRVSVLGFPLSVLADRNRDGEIDIIVPPGAIPIPRLQELEEITFLIEDLTEGRDGLNISEDFLPLEAAAFSSGLALFKESGAVPDRFNFTTGDPSSDIPVDLISRPQVEVDPTNPRRFFVTMRPVPSVAASRLPVQQTSFPSFYLVARSSLNLRHGDTFRVSIPANGIKVREISDSPMPDLRAYRVPFPDEIFAPLNPLFAEPSVFQGDIVQLVNQISDTDNSYRIDNSSEARTIIGIDYVGRPDEDYFIREVKVNFIGLNLASVGRLIAQLIDPVYAPMGVGFMQTTWKPSFFYSPHFYNFPEDPENPGFTLTERRMIGEDEIEYPVTMPLDFNGIPRSAFLFANDDPERHVTSYVPFGPREAYTDGLRPSHVAGRNVFAEILPSGPGGIFLFRDIGGQPGQFDPGVDRVIKLDNDRIRVETFPLTLETIAENPGIRNAVGRLFPGRIGGAAGRRALAWLLEDTNLAEDLLGVSGAIIDDIQPEDALNNPRPPFGSLECYEDPDCMFFDQIINVARPYFGLTEGTVRYLNSLTDTEKTNMMKLFRAELFQAFTYTLPISRDNSLGDLQAPNSRTGVHSGPDLYLAVRTSDDLRNLDSLVPFIQPRDVTIGNNLRGFLQREDVPRLPSVSSIGLGRRNTDTTFALVGRPRPRFMFQDMTQPGEGIFANQHNIMYDRAFNSPPKAVIGIDAVDFGSNPIILENDSLVETANPFEAFFTESPVLGEIQIEFLPGRNQETIIPTLFNIIPLQLGMSQGFAFPVSQHSIALYQDDSTPTGDGIDNDGDGLIDEEYYNLQDDDGDGLIDEDLGDGSPAGITGAFDANDRFLPTISDRWGTGSTVQSSQYVFQPSDPANFEDYLQAVIPADADITTEAGGLMPLNINEGSWFAELDFRALQYTDYSIPRNLIFPPSGMRPFNPGGPPLYNQGMFQSLDQRQGLIDIYSIIMPHLIYTEDLCFETVDGETICMLTLDGGENNIGNFPAPDPADPMAVRTSFLLGLANALRVPNPERAFARVGNIPMVVDVPSPNAQNPQGGSQNDLFTQFGHGIQTADTDAIFNYIGDLIDSLGEAVANAQEAIADYQAAVADAEGGVEPGEEPNYPDAPDPIEVGITHPYNALGIQQFLQEGGEYQTNYMYQVQLPDENFGPLAGNDFYVVLRSSPQARVGDSFRVRIRSGNLQRQHTYFDPDEGQVSIDAPVGGIQYLSYVNTAYDEEEPFRGVSKNQITTRDIIVRSQNVSPTIRFLSPSTGLNLTTSAFMYEVVYQVDDPDSSPEIRLFWDDNSIGFDGTFIPGSLTRPPVGRPSSFMFNLQEQVENFDPTKDYYIYARVDDGVNPPVFTYADGPIRTPASVVDRPDGDGDRIVVHDELPNRFDYVKMTDDGRTFSLGEMPGLPDFQPTERVIAIKLAPGFGGYLALQKDGKVIAMGDVGPFQSFVRDNNEVVYPGAQVAFYRNSADGGELIENPEQEQITIERARAIEVDFDRRAIYVLDGDGDMFFLGANADRELRPPAVGMDLYRAMRLAPNGQEMYFLSGDGILSVAKGTPQVVWSSISEDVNRYPDFELITQGLAVTNVVITNNDGELTVLGPDTSRRNRLASFRLQPVRGIDSVDPGAVRKVRRVPGTLDVLLLVEGNGRVHYMSDAEIPISAVPDDPFVFSDSLDPEDDRVVDISTANIDLRSVVESVRDIFRSFERKDAERILSYASPNYFDRNGADIVGLRKSLQSMFAFYEVGSFTESRNTPEHFTITNLGDRIVANVVMDAFFYFPRVQYHRPAVETGTSGARSRDNFVLFSDRRPGIPQTVRIREMMDGRSWTIEVWRIRNYGRYQDQITGGDNIGDEDLIRYLQRQAGNTRIATYAPKNEGKDPPLFIRVEERDTDPFAQFALMFIYQEQTIVNRFLAPAMEYTYFDGQFISVMGAINNEFVFTRQDDGSYKMSSMVMTQVMGENDQSFDLIGQTGTIFDDLEQEVEQPFGFSFIDRGPVITSFPGEADFVLQGDSLLVTSPRGAIMMLPEGTDIFSLNVESFLRTVSRSTVVVNPYDPEPPGDQGSSASLQPGRAYFVITRDGGRFGFIQVSDQLPTELGLDLGLTLFDYRFQEDWVLPTGF